MTHFINYVIVTAVYQYNLKKRDIKEETIFSKMSNYNFKMYDVVYRTSLKQMHTGMLYRMWLWWCVCYTHM